MIDLGDEIDRQAFLSENPDVDRKETFLALMQQTDFDDAEILLKGEDEVTKGRKWILTRITTWDG